MNDRVADAESQNGPLSRRQFLKRSVLLAACATGVGAGAVSARRKKNRPNIFFFFADDWGKYASIYDSFGPNKALETPVIDEFARDGIRFNNAHVTAPSCTPCRSSLLSGQYFYRTGLGAILQGAKWDAEIPSYPLLLEKAGYHIGYTYKVWSPGSPVDAPYGGKAREYAKAGRRFCSFSQSATELVKGGMSPEEAKKEICGEALRNFEDFLGDRKGNQPFCYWFGPTNTHRKWIQGSGKDLWGLEPDDLKGRMPKFLPDVHEIREDMCDYLGEVLALDRMLGLLLKKLDEIGERENTLIVVSGDHGIPGFPRGKCNLYDFGTHVPLLAQWKSKARGGWVVDDFVNLMDLAPTFLDAASEVVPECMTGRSIVPLLTSRKNGWIDPKRDHVITGRERHVAKAREGQLPYLDGMSSSLHGNRETAEKDREIRSWLRSNGYHVIEITYVELDDRNAMVRHFKKLAKYLSGKELAKKLAKDKNWFDKSHR